MTSHQFFNPDQDSGIPVDVLEEKAISTIRQHSHLLAVWYVVWYVVWHRNNSPNYLWSGFAVSYRPLLDIYYATVGSKHLFIATKVYLIQIFLTLPTIYLAISLWPTNGSRVCAFFSGSNLFQCCSFTQGDYRPK